MVCYSWEVIGGFYWWKPFSCVILASATGRGRHFFFQVPDRPTTRTGHFLCAFALKALKSPSESLPEG